VEFVDWCGFFFKEQPEGSLGEKMKSYSPSISWNMMLIPDAREGHPGYLTWKGLQDRWLGES
jgi:hypothetical protein